MTQQNKTARGLIVGTGLAGIKLHLAAYRRLGVEIRAFVDISAENAKKVAAANGVAAGYGSIEEAVKNEDVDFCSICTPPTTHFELARRAVEAGCHVLVEKPVASSYEQARQLQQLAQEKGRIVAVVHNRRFLKGMIEAAELLKSGAIGRVLHVDRQMHFCPETVRMMEPEHWSHQIPGGRFFEANPHSAYLVRQFVQDLKVTDVEIFRRSNRWPHIPITGFSALLRGRNFENDEISATITMSFDNEKTARSKSGTQLTIVHGSRATMVVAHSDCYLVDRLTSPEFAVKTLKTSVRRRLQNLLSKFNPALKKSTDGAQHEFMIGHFVRQVQGQEKDLLVSWDEILEAQKLNDDLGQAVQAKIDALPKG